jgi:hypothetical protein
MAEGSQSAQVFRLDDGRFRQAFLQDRQDFHALDRVDAQVGIQRHVQFQHLHRIARLLRHDLTQNASDLVRVPALHTRADRRCGVRHAVRMVSLSIAEEIGDMAECAQRAEVFRLNDGRFGQAFLQDRQNFDALD